MMGVGIHCAEEGIAGLEKNVDTVDLVAGRAQQQDIAMGEYVADGLAIVSMHLLMGAHADGMDCKMVG